MSTRTVDRVDDWDTVPFAGGYGGLQDLAADEFSGVVVAGPARLCMIRGTVVGVLDGSIEDFEDAGGTAREAPHPALPLLAVMQERSEEVRAKYYTEDTPISEVDRTLSDGGFTGFVELSDNVLSGDYYLVYHRGQSMSVAYVGAAERLVTDDEAFRQADDEVGIYQVRPVDIEPVDIPEPAGDDAAGASADASGDEPADEPPADDGARSTDRAADSASGSTAATDPDAAAGDATASTGATAAEAATEPADRAADADPGAAADPEAAATDTETGSDATGGSTAEPTEGGQADPQASQSGSASDRTGSSRAESESAETRVEQTGGQSGADEAQSDSRRRRDTASSDAAATDSGDARQSGSARTDQPAGDAPAETRGAAGQSPARDREGARSQSGSQGGAGQPPSGGQASPQSGSETDARRNAGATGSPSTGGRAAGAGSAESAADLETRSIPSINPSRTHAASTESTPDVGTGQPSAASATARRDDAAATDSAGAAGDQSTGAKAGERRAADSGPSRSRGDGESAAGNGANGDAGGSTQADDDAGASAGETGEEPPDSERALAELRSELAELEAEREDLATERDDLAAERDRLESELREARAEIERLEERLADAGAEGADAATQLSPREAVDQTNLFVRYDSKGDATLESAHAGDADRSAVDANLRLEYHTQFDADAAAVGSEPFEDFLADTIQYRFVDWLVGRLLYEIRDTGHADAMAELYDALPRIDRAELNGQVSVQYTENGEETRTQERFDVVVRDRMGNPLVVANINDSRDPATDSMMTDLVKRAERVGTSSDSLAAAVLVTESFFEPEALETADGATSSGLLSRDKRKSFVNLSRKGGYHLCLVEARNKEFHLAVPEL